MPKFEHKYFFVAVGPGHREMLAVVEDGVDIKKKGITNTQLIRDIGLEGWEIVAAVGSPRAHTLYLKRQISE